MFKKNNYKKKLISLYLETKSSNNSKYRQNIFLEIT